MERSPTLFAAVRHPSPRLLRLLQPALVLSLVVAAALVYALSAGVRAEIAQALHILSRGDVHALQAYLRSFGGWAPAVSLLLMVLQALAAPMPSFLVTFANGLAFGVLWGWLLSLAGQMLAASVCFWLARGLGRDVVAALVGRLGLQAADGWVAHRGARGIVVARLLPGVAFDAVSYAAGLTRLGYWQFIAATTIGVAPQTLAYAYLGETAPRLVWALLAVTVLVLVAGLGATLWRRRRAAPRPCPDHSPTAS